MEQPRATDHERRLLLPASLFGMAAILALPLSATPAGRIVPALVFATPITLVLVGMLHRHRGVVVTGAALAVALLVLALAVASGVDPGVLGNLAPLVLLVGPVVAVIAVGRPLREVDVVAAAGFLISATIAVIAGFAAAQTPGAAGLVLGVGLLGFAIVAARIGRRAPTGER
ncbi:MAG: hypothetical protein EA387_05150 [Nitriliruptor sp.]|nr:MAG: hypothetical protein EA387_05150 [Nitriliruptor sp.]